MENLNISFPQRVSDYRFKYQGQYDYQPAYFELDPSDRTLICDYSGEIGNAIPFYVYHGMALRFHFDPCHKLKDVRATMKEIGPLCAKLVDSFDTRWDGNNWRGVWDQELLREVYNTMHNTLG